VVPPQRTAQRRRKWRHGHHEGRCSRITYRLVRSTRVPIAERSAAPHRKPLPMQVSDAHPLLFGRIPRRDLSPPRTDHRRIVQPPAAAAGDRAPVSPPFPRSRIDTHHPARRAGDTLRDQPCEPPTLRRLRRRTRPTTNRRNSPIPPVSRRSLESARGCPGQNHDERLAHLN
jgi:hypothetical protein